MLDVGLSFVGLGLLSPLLLTLSAAVAATMGRPVFFRQLRGGRNGRPFYIVKFRTMTDARGAGGELLPNEQRVSRLGRFLRSTSLDELPELWNVLRGDMSLVGPRPLLVEYVPLYTPAQAERLTVPPGLTGWAQVNGRNALTWPAKFEFDRWYVRNRSIALDLRILFLTLWIAVRRQDVDHGDSTGAPLWDGSTTEAD